MGLWWLSRYSTYQQIQTAYAAVPRSNPATSTVTWIGPGHKTVYQKQNLRLAGVSTGVKKNALYSILSYTLTYCNLFQGRPVQSLKKENVIPFQQSPNSLDNFPRVFTPVLPVWTHFLQNNLICEPMNGCKPVLPSRISFDSSPAPALYYKAKQKF
jgi:hypothetical protein